jgi:hypothetical protein
MLKIDAMSIADTLEGYPDLFINVLTGDSLAAGGLLPITSHSTNPNHHVDATNEEKDHLLYHDNDIDGAISPGPVPDHRQAQSHRRTSYPSYGRLTEYEMDPDTYTAQTMTNESRKESCCMMMGFVLFAVVPSIIYTLVPTILFGPQHDAAGIHFSSIFDQHQDSSTSVSTAQSGSTHVDSSISSSMGTSSSTTTTTTAAGPTTTAVMMNPNTIIIVATASIMWCLGVWKSRFIVSSSKRNWFIFGVETVMVLIICIVCAYGVGTILNHTFLPNEYVLQVVQQQQQQSAQHVATKRHEINTSTRQRPPTGTNLATEMVDVTSTVTSSESHRGNDNIVVSTKNNNMNDSVPSKTTTSKNDDVASHPHYWYSF